MKALSALGLSASELPGLAVALACAAVSTLVADVVGLSPIVVGVVAGIAVATMGMPQTRLRAGFTYGARRLVRVGVVLLGLQLSFEHVRDLGAFGAGVVVAVVVVTFASVQLVARALGLSPGLGLLTATGFSICGTSAVAAMAPVTDAKADETAYAVGLVTLCGTLSIFLLPVVGTALGLTADQFGVIAGAGVHDVGQVTATAAAYSEDSEARATLVKLTRVVMLAPMVGLVGLWRRRDRVETVDVRRPPLIPLFVVGFLVAILVRSSGALHADTLDAARSVQRFVLAAGLFCLGTGVDVRRLRRLGGRPLVLGLSSWAIVLGLAFAASALIPLPSG